MRSTSRRTNPLASIRFYLQNPDRALGAVVARSVRDTPVMMAAGVASGTDGSPTTSSMTIHARRQLFATSWTVSPAYGGTEILMEVDEPKNIRIRPLYQDTSVPAPARDMWIEIRSADLIEGGPAPVTWGFTRSAEVLVSSLIDLPARTRGDFTELAVDLYAPIFPERPEYLCEVDLLLRGEVIGTKIFRKATQRHQFVVSTQILFEDANVLEFAARMMFGEAEAARFFVRAFYVQKDRLIHHLEKTCIWIFSTARSGSTWLSHDILCWNGRTRPMDEPGLGRMFAPFDWVAERFYDLPRKAAHFQSGLDYESKKKIRDGKHGIPPFERAFIYAGQENQIWSMQNWSMYLETLKDTAFRHVINEWG